MCLAEFSGTQHFSISLVFKKSGQFHFFDTLDGTVGKYVILSKILLKMFMGERLHRML